MSWWWLFLIIPAYVFAYGVTVPVLHNHPSHHACGDGTDYVPCKVVAVAWPLLIAVCLVVGIASAGTRAEALRPSRRRQERDKKIARDEKALGMRNG